MPYARIILVALLIISSCAADLISRVKNSTAFLDVPEAGSTGTAFCISDKGHFATCAHVLVDIQVGQEVSLTANSGLPNAKTTKAKVLKIDKSLDLAILKTEPGFTPALKIGTSDALTETNAVTAAGFPLGRLLARGRSPAISISTGKVTALRREGDILARVQFDAEIQPGNSGGPLLNAKGEVIGIVVSKIVASKINFAIGTDLLKLMWFTPHCEIDLPGITPFSDRHQAISFNLNLDYLTPPSTPPKVTAVFVGDQSGSRPVTVKKNSEMQYTITGVPHPASHKVSSHILRTDLVRVSGNFTHKNSLSHHDFEFKIGKESHLLSNFKSIQPGENSATTKDGKTIKGLISGLDRVKVQIVGQSPQLLSFSDWQLISIRPEKFALETIHFEVKILTGEFVSTINHQLMIESPDGIGNLNLLPGGPIFKKPDENIPRISKPVEIPLEAEMANLDYGGNGRFVIALIPTKKVCLIIDCLTGQITHRIPAEPTAKIAAGLTTLFIADSSGFSKWDLETGKNIARNLQWLDGKVHAITAGSGSDRFFGVLYSAYNLKDMVRVELRSQAKGTPLALEPLSFGHHITSINPSSRIEISDRGTTLGVFFPSFPSSSTGVFLIKDNGYTFDIHEDLEWLRPGPADRTIATGRGHIGLTQQGFGDSERYPKGYGLIPTSLRDLALMVPLPKRDSKARQSTEIGLLNTNTGLPLIKNMITMDELENLQIQNSRHNGRNDFPQLTWDKRFHYSTNHGLLITAPPGDSLLKVYPLDLEETLAKAQNPFLIIKSNAPVQINGEKFEAQLTTISSESNSTFEILSAPENFKINSSGLLRGKLNPADTGSLQNILIRVKAGDLERLWNHSFTIE